MHMHEAFVRAYLCGHAHANMLDGLCACTCPCVCACVRACVGDSLNVCGHVCTRLAFNKKGDLLAIGYNDKLRIVDITSGSKLRVDEHRGGFESVTFDADGRRVAAGCRDGRLLIFNITRTKQSGKVAHEIRHPSGVCSVAFSADGELLATGCRDGCLRVFRVNTKLARFPEINVVSDQHGISHKPSHKSWKRTLAMLKALSLLKNVNEQEKKNMDVDEVARELAGFTDEDVDQSVTSDPAFSNADVGKMVSITGNDTLVDGKVRFVNWGDAEHSNTQGTIKSVDPKHKGKVVLEGGSVFENAADQKLAQAVKVAIQLAKLVPKDLEEADEDLCRSVARDLDERILTKCPLEACNCQDLKPARKPQIPVITSRQNLINPLRSTSPKRPVKRLCSFHESFTRSYPALSKADVGKVVTIDGDDLIIDDMYRTVDWGIARHGNCTEEIILSVEASVGGNVKLSNNAGFHNPSLRHISHYHIGHNYIDHICTGHNYVGHICIFHNYIGSISIPLSKILLCARRST